jgi:hypothetical protein
MMAVRTLLKTAALSRLLLLRVLLLTSTVPRLKIPPPAAVAVLPVTVPAESVRCPPVPTLIAPPLSVRPLRSVRAIRVSLPAPPLTSKNRKSVGDERVIVALLSRGRAGCARPR